MQMKIEEWIQSIIKHETKIARSYKKQQKSYDRGSQCRHNTFDRLLILNTKLNSVRCKIFEKPNNIRYPLPSSNDS